MVTPMSDNIVTMPRPADQAGMDIVDELPVAYVEMNEKGMIVRANRLSHSLHPSHTGDLIGKHAWELMPVGEQKLSHAAFFQAMASPHPLPKARRHIYTTSEEYRVYELHRSIIRNAEGRATGMRVVSVDVTESHRAEEEAQRERAWLENMLGSFPEAVIVIDALGFLRNVNTAAEGLFAAKAEELVGEAIEDVMPLVSYTSNRQAELNHRLVLDQPSRGVAVFLDRQRQEVRAEISTSPILDKESGFTSGVVAILRRVES
jgi:PAS domain S-box-containing protein